jgi:hypothetical protein
MDISTVELKKNCYIRNYFQQRKTKEKITKHSYVVHQGNAFRLLAENTWTANRSSDGRALDAGGPVTGVLPSLVLLQLMLMMQIRQSAVQVELTMFLKMSPTSTDLVQLCLI